jgi:hypothetical protein
MFDTPSMSNALMVCASTFLLGLGAGTIIRLLSGGNMD